MKKQFSFVIALIATAAITILAFTPAGCYERKKWQQAPAAEFDLPTVKKEIESANSNFMELFNKSDSTSLANCYTMDAKFMAPNITAAAGRQNIQKVMGEIIRSGAGKLQLKLLNVWGSEALLAEEGEMIVSTKNGQQLDKGKYLVLWKKEDGKWKLFRDFFNSDLALPAAK